MLQNPIKHNSNNFDFIRLAAAIAVIFSHSWYLLDAPGKFFPSDLTPGNLGVYSFFIISGYLITRSCENHYQSFWRNRILRLGPGLLINVFITLFIIGPIFTELTLKQYATSPDIHRYLLSIANGTMWLLPGVFTHNPLQLINGSLWTLSKEVMMYVIIWAVATLGLTYKKLIPVLVLLFSILTIYQLYRNTPYANEIQWNKLFSHNLAILFMIGSGFYVFRNKITFKLSLLSFLALLSITGFYFDNQDIFVCVFLPYALFYFAFSKAINFHNAARYGDFSYGLYIYSSLVQQIIIQLFHNEIKPWPLFFYSLPISFICAFLSWHLVEKKMLKLK